MLDPQQDRRQLFDALRPPDGYRLDRAVGTTYSLDLLALLTVPLAYTVWDGEAQQGELLQDPLALLHGIRQVADRLAIFCQAGQISVPRANQRLFAYLEETVVEVTPRHKDGVFHPKVWLLRYAPSENESDPIRYRLLCLSRNLTFDQSWDTMLVLDGVYQAQRKVAYSRNHPLGDFIAALPDLAVSPVKPAIREAVAKLSDEVRRVAFETPGWDATFEFIPMGLTGRRSRPFRQTVRRQLIVSPFVDDYFLKEMATRSSHNILISRLESVMAVSPAVLARFAPVYVLDPTAVPETDDAEAAATEADSQPLSPPSGLHAKLFVSEYSYSTVELFTGSANATNAAFSKNVEFLVKFTGWGSEIGIDKLLAAGQDDDQVRLLDLLQEFEPAAAAAEPDAIQEALEKLANEWQRRLARLPLTARLASRSTSASDADTTFDVTLEIQADETATAERLHLPDHVQIRCWPITLRPEAAVPVVSDSQTIATIHGLSYAALTAFFAFVVTVGRGENQHTTRFVRNLPLIGAPDDRQEQVLRALLDNQQQTLRYLLFLLADSDAPFADSAALFQMQTPVDGQGRALSLPVDLFESLVRALYQDPVKLDQVHKLYTDLQKTENTDLLPDGFEAIWQPVWQARQQLRSEENNP
jgi:hypothetical protein